MNKFLRNCLTAILVVTALLFSALNVSAEESVVFSGTQTAFWESTLLPYDALVGVSAVRGTQPMDVRVVGVQRVTPLSALSDGEGGMIERGNSIADVDFETNGKFTMSASYPGAIYWVEYAAFASSSDNVPIATVKRAVVQVLTDDPYVVAATPQDEQGLTGRCGSTITYSVFLYNGYDDDIFDVTCPVPAGTTFVSADNGGTLQGGKVLWGISIDAGRTKEIHLTVSVNSGMEEKNIDCKLFYVPQSYSQATYHSNNNAVIRTVISGTAHTHTYGDWVSNGDETHSRYCTVDGCEAFERENCYGGKANCHTAAVCNGCHTSYGAFDMTNHTGSREYQSKNATCQEDGYENAYVCLSCKTVLTPGTTLPRVAHSFGEWEKNSDGSWGKTCIYGCGTKETESITITWGALEFSWDSGEWDTDTHEWKNGGWKPDETDGNKIQVSNSGNTEVRVQVDYQSESAYSHIVGNVTDRTEIIAQPIGLSVSGSKSFYLELSGEPQTETADYVKIGSITITLLHDGG